MGIKGTGAKFRALNKVQQAKYNLDWAIEREETGGVARPDPDGVEYKLLYTDYYSTYKA